MSLEPSELRVGETIRAAALALEREAALLSVGATEEIQTRMPELPPEFVITSLPISAAREVVAGFARSLTRDVDPARAPVPEEVLEHVRMYVRRGIDLALLLRTYRVGQSVLWKLWRGVVEAQTDDVGLRLAVRNSTEDALFAYMDLATSRAAEEYYAERERWSRNAAAQREQVVRDLLEGRTVDPDAASRVLGRELRRHHRAFVVWTSDGEEATDAPLRLVSAGKAFAAGHGDDRPLLVPVGQRQLWGWCSVPEDGHGGGSHSSVGWTRPTGAARGRVTNGRRRRPVMAATSGRSPSKVTTRTGRDASCDAEDVDEPEVQTGRFDGISLAVGDPGMGVEGFRRSHRQALAARRVAVMTPDVGPEGRQRSPVLPDGRVVAWPDVAVLALLVSDLDLARDFSRRVLGNLDAEDEPTTKLRQTLVTFLDEGEHVGRTASLLGIHVNTVTNRVRQCESVLGHPLCERRTDLRAALAVRETLR